jgi:hypothetical protein
VKQNNLVIVLDIAVLQLSVDVSCCKYSWRLEVNLCGILFG